MRTTLEIDDSILAAARALAADEGISLGKALSTLARRGMEPRGQQHSSGFPVFEVDLGAPPITVQLVNQYRDES